MRRNKEIRKMKAIRARCHLHSAIGAIMFVLLFSSNVMAQISFVASAPKSVAENENFTLTYTLNNATGSYLQPPSMSDFTLIGGPNTSTSMQIMNGVMSQSATYTYVLRPTKQGTFHLTKASIVANGKMYDSNDLTIEVTAAGTQSQSQPGNASNQKNNQQPQTDDDLTKQLKDEVFVKVILSRSSVYKGELLTATYRLYFRENLNGFNLVKSPSMDGFWSKDVDLDPKRKPTVESVNGKQFYTIDILKYNLYPQRAGTLQISPAEVSTVAQVTLRPKARDPFSDPFGDPFSDFFGQTKNVPLDLTTDAATVNVKELPEDGKPKEFSGAVGKFNFETSLSTNESKTDDPVTYTVKISGTGNLSLVDAPTLQLPNGFEVYDPKIKENIDNGSAGISGSRQYDFLIVPRLPGDFKIAGQSFAYFDPSTEKYVLINTPEYPLKITGEPSKNFSGNASSYVTQQGVSTLGQDIRYIKTAVPSFDKNQTSFFGSPGYAALYAFPFLAFIGLIVARKRNEELAADITGARRRRALKLAKKRLSLAEKNLAHHDRKNFYDEVSRAIWGYLGDKLNIDMAELSKETVAEKLLAREVTEETISKLQSLINTCEVSLYAPSSGDAEMKIDYATALHLIADLEDQIKTRNTDRSPARAIIPLLIVALGLSFMAFGQSSSEIYNSANQSYKAKQFREAADDYEKLISQNYSSEEIYYNLGNCYYKMDSVAKSILNFERAHKLAPRDEDISYNLRLAKLKAVDNIQPVPQLPVIVWWNEFVSINNSQGWGVFALVAVWLSILVFALSFVFGRRRIFNAAALLLLLLSFSSLALASHQRSEEQKQDAAIVITPSSFVKSAPDAGSSNLFLIHEGTRIEVLDHVGDWSKVKLEDGKVGWIGRENFESI